MTERSTIDIGPHTIIVEMGDEKIYNIRISDQPESKKKNTNNKIKQNTIIVQVKEAMRKFADGDASAFDTLPIDVAGTPFQRKVWNATRKIPYGQTRTYAEIAKQIGHPKAVRAVGTALGKNPVCIIVPCHRVVPSSGGIGNYAYGAAVKRWLLEHEAGKASPETAQTS